ncbi:MAG TPA: methionine adenosyltransferase [Candidatus Aminicenantes bacterium]|nr:methionine adenosyltransferase [Candidatus Aminicenantes bacterium]
MVKGTYLFTSESVTEGHPDKICDQISDAILDECLRQDPESRVAVECLTKTGMVVVAGELTTTGYIHIPHIVRKTLTDIGYTRSSYGIDAETCAVLVHLEEQSPDIDQGVTATSEHEQGAGDQGMMFGFACRENHEFMPLAIHLSHKLTQRLAEVRKSKELDYLGPDGKSQVTVEYRDGKPTRVTAVVISNQHDEGIPHDRIEADVIAKVIRPVCGDWLNGDTRFYVNPTGQFVRGGPFADAGLTGRKIIVDTYGGMGRHGGGAFSGKDPSKVDRSATYVARYIAKNLVAAEIADKCEIQLAYAIGVAEPVSVNVNFFGSGKITEERAVQIVRQVFPLKPADILRELDLRRPIYLKTASYGHFGRDTFPWEQVNRVEKIRELAGI